MNFNVFKFEKDAALFSNKWYFFNEQDEEVYHVKHPGMFSSANIQLVDNTGQSVLEIDRHWFQATYHLVRNGERIASVKKVFALFKNEFKVETTEAGHISVIGNLFSKEYRFMKGDDEFAFVSRKRFAFFNDRYGIAVREGINPLLVLGIVIVIQVVLKQQESGAA